VNTGAWQRVASPQYIQDQRKDGQTAYDVLGLSPEALAPCYSLVEIRAGHEAEPDVLFWREKNGVWGFDSACPADPTLLEK
jgi:hypothetical protein